MKKIDQQNCASILSWCENPEPGALDQATSAAQLPFLVEHVALMPDTHPGYGVPIGSVIAAEGVVIPNAVGVDISCGLVAVESTLVDIEMSTLKQILGDIRKVIPVGFNHHKSPQVGMPIKSENTPIVSIEYDKARNSLGTLGGGNHFLEIQRSSNNIWVMIHSGSRNLGLIVAKHYNNIAKELNQKWYSSVPVKFDMAFLPLDSAEGKLYLSEMEFCMRYAKKNRDLMMERTMIIINKYTDCSFKEVVGINHNYARLENHFGRNVIVHRKGATSAKLGEIGIIPGSQGTSSYIVRGLGNKASFESCSHGAGRKMGRKAAERDLDLNIEIEKLNSLGILHSIRGKSDLDEAPGAYKDISTVMAEQSDLVEIVTKLEPLAVIKG